MGIAPEGGLPDGGRPDAAQDAGTHPRPDGGASGCEVPGEPVVIESPGEPCFAYSLDRDRLGGYVLGGACGWPSAGGVRAGLWILDPALHPLRHLAVPGETALARYDRANDEMVVVVEDDNVVTLIRYDASSSDLPQVAETPVCADCAPAWSSPVLGYDGAAVAVRRLRGDALLLYLVPRDAAGAPLETPPRTGMSPQAVLLPTGPALLYVQDGLAWIAPFDWQGVATEPARALVPWIPMAGLLGAGNGPDAPGGGPDAWVVALGNDGEVATLYLLRGLAGDPAVVAGAAAGAVDAVLEAAVGVTPRTAAVAWGVNYGAGRVGAHAVVFDDTDTAPLFGPALVSEPLSAQSASHTVWAVTAPHPEGHAVVWGGWREETYNGLYGKVLRCLPRSRRGAP